MKIIGHITWRCRNQFLTAVIFCKSLKTHSKLAIKYFYSWKMAERYEKKDTTIAFSKSFIRAGYMKLSGGLCSFKARFQVPLGCGPVAGFPWTKVRNFDAQGCHVTGLFYIKQEKYATLVIKQLPYNPTSKKSKGDWLFWRIFFFQNSDENTPVLS